MCLSRRWVKSSGIEEVSTFYPLDSIEDGAAKSQVCSAQPLSPLPLEEAPSFRRHISGVKMAGGWRAELRLPAAISTSPFLLSFLPSLPTQLCSSSFPSFISVQTKAPKWLECLRQMDALSFLGSPSNNSKCLNRRDALYASENRAARRG